jgi:hypothetical protein
MEMKFDLTKLNASGVVDLGSDEQRRGRTSDFGIVPGSKRLDEGLRELGRWTWANSHTSVRCRQRNQTVYGSMLK